MMNFEEDISKRHINSIDASISHTQNLITFSNKLLLTAIIKTVGFRHELSHISLHAVNAGPELEQVRLTYLGITGSKDWITDVCDHFLLEKGLGGARGRSGVGHF